MMNSSISERIQEIEMLCNREKPGYDQISNFSVALYVLKHLNASDAMSVADVDSCEASAILRDYFNRIDAKDIPVKYNTAYSDHRYLLVVGDPSAPEHFAALIDLGDSKPFFSKPEYRGSGFDSLEELIRELSCNGNICDKEIHYFEMR